MSNQHSSWRYDVYNTTKVLCGDTKTPKDVKAFTILSHPTQHTVSNLHGGTRTVWRMAILVFQGGYHSIEQLEAGNETMKAMMRAIGHLNSWLGYRIELVRYPSATKKQEIATASFTEIQQRYYSAATMSLWGQSRLPREELLSILSAREQIKFSQAL